MPIDKQPIRMENLGTFQIFMIFIKVIDIKLQVFLIKLKILKFVTSVGNVTTGKILKSSLFQLWIPLRPLKPVRGFPIRHALERCWNKILIFFSGASQPISTKLHKCLTNVILIAWYITVPYIKYQVYPLKCINLLLTRETSCF